MGKKGLWASMRGAGRRRKDRGDSGTPKRGVLRARGERIKWASRDLHKPEGAAEEPGEDSWEEPLGEDEAPDM